MSREEAIQLLGEGATEEQIKSLLDKFHAKDNELRTKTNELNNIQSQLDDTNKKLNNTQSQLDAINKAQMTDAEKMEAQKKEADEYLANSKKIFAKAKAQEILSSVGITDEELINSLVTDDVDLTVKNANIYVNNIKTISESVEKKTKEALSAQDLKPTPSNNVSNNNEGMTWEKYQTLSESEQSAFANEHPEEFAKL
jgi:phage-related minor tail protein